MKEADEYAEQAEHTMKSDPKGAHVYAMLAVAASVQDVYAVLDGMLTLRAEELT